MRLRLVWSTLLLALGLLATSCGSGTSNASGERTLAEPAEAADVDAAVSAEEPAKVDDLETAAEIETATEVETAAEVETATEVETEVPVVEAPDLVRCLVQLHGKGGRGGDSSVRDDGIVVLWPDGNGTGWGGLQWEYDSEEALQEATTLIAASMDRADCDRAVVHGFSNGASMTAALHCSGNNLGGRLVGVVVDDPVTDAATVGCAPATEQIVLYWTGGLAATVAGTDCAQIDWTCAGGFIRGIDAYAADLGVAATQSPQTEHQWNFDTPFPVMWLG